VNRGRYLTDEEVAEIRKRVEAEGMTYKELADLLGLRNTTLSRILGRKQRASEKLIARLHLLTQPGKLREVRKEKAREFLVEALVTLGGLTRDEAEAEAEALIKRYGLRRR